MPEKKSEIELETPSKDKDGTKTESKKPQERVSFRELFRYADSLDKVCIFFGLICAIASGGSMPLYSYIFGELIDAYNKGQDHMYDEMKKVVIYVIYLGIGTGISYWGRTFFWMFSSERQIKRIREHYVSAILRQEVAWFDAVGSGELATRIAGDTIVVVDGMGDKVGLFIQCAAMFVCGMVMGFVRGWKLALVILSVVPLLAICGALMIKMLVALSTRGQKAYAVAGNIAEEVLSAIRTVVAFGGEEKEVKRYSQSLDDAAVIGIKKTAIGGMGRGFTFFCIFGTYALTLWYGGKLVVHDDTYTGGRVVNVMWSVIFAAFMLGQAGPNMEAIAKARGAAYTIFQTIDRKPLIDASSEDGDRPSKFKGNIELKEVHFKYPTRPDTDIFNGISISVKAGQKIALVGKSGCGKSSVVALLQRFYDTNEGQILLDGHDIKTLNIKWLRQQFGYVGQEPVLFSGTIAENISFGQNVTQEEIEGAAKAANAHNFIIQLPEGYQTHVGERGAQLSGGQKQRIAIARAILKNPKILLLDEATSALDSESEKVVQDSLDNVMQGRTTIIIAHRLSTIRDVDTIYVIKDGKVVESGTHEELVNKEGLYSELVHAQTSQADMPKSRSKTISSNDNNAKASAQKTSRKEEDKEEEMSSTAVLKRLLKLNRPEIPHLVIGTLAAIATGVVQPMFSILLSHIINIYYKPAHEIEHKLVPWVIGFLALGVGTFICMFLQSFMMGIAGEKLTKRIRELSFRAMIQQDIGWFDQKEHASGKLTSMLATDATLVQNLLGPRLALAVSNVATLVAAIIIALIHAWKLSLVILATLPLLAFGNTMNALTTKGVAVRTRSSVAEANQVATEAIQNIRTVAAFTNEQRFSSTFSHNLEGPTKLSLRSATLSGLLVGIGQFLIYASLALGYWYGGKLLEKGDITFLDMMSVFMAIFMGASAIGNNTAMAPDTVAAKLAADAIFKLIDKVSPINALSPEGKHVSSDLKSDIEFNSIQFTYPTRPDAQVFSDLTLKIPSGKVVALVGPSGCGKSSVVALLERFYDPQRGGILVDGENMKEFNLKSWRSQIGLVGQEPVLFSGTIADNISYGKPNATQEEIEGAAKAANAHNFIKEFPDGYQTEVGEKGAQLSGGQKQRIAIARAIIRNPKILLLDEATSALDSESEKIVQDALDSVMQGRTTIIIAHRLSTIKNADIIYLIQRGRIEETGTHEELMKLGGLYYNLVERQT